MPMADDKTESFAAAARNLDKAMKRLAKLLDKASNRITPKKGTKKRPKKRTKRTR